MKKIYLLAAVLLLISFAAKSNTYTVASTADAGAGSLRAAVDSANANPGQDSIVLTLATTDTIFVLSPFNWVSDSLIVTGLPCSNPTISGGNIGFNNSLFWVSNTNMPLTLNYLNFTGCYNNGDGQGGVANSFYLYLNYCYFFGNTAWGGFGSNGGAIEGHFVNANNCTFSGNSAIDGDGPGEGGAAIVFEAANFYNCTFYNNEADDFASAMYVPSAGNIINCTFANNSVGGQFGAGGVIFNNATPSNNINIANCIFWGNTSTGSTPGIWFVVNTNSGGCNILQQSSDNSDFVTTSSDSLGVDPKLGTFGYYGGCVPVMPILCQSIAQNHATCTGATTTDARDMATYGQRDAGAFELQKPFSVNLGNDTTVCGSITLGAGNPGDSYSWSTSETTQTITVSGSGTYSVTVTNASGCSVADTITLIVNPLPVETLGPPVTQCGGSVTLVGGVVVDADTYVWSTGSTADSIIVSTSGLYSITVTDENSCTVSASVNIYIQPTPQVNLGNSITQCGGSVTLDADNVGDTYNWSTTETTQFITVNSSNSYSVTVTDPNSSCSASASINVTINAIPAVNLGAAVTQCGGSVLIGATDQGIAFQNNYNFNWSSGQNGDATFDSITVFSSGTYSVTVTDINNCSATGSAMITINPVPTVYLPADTSACGTYLVLDAGAGAGYSYSWYDESGNRTDTAFSSDVYGVVVYNSYDCSASAETNVTLLSAPVVNLGPDINQCGGTVSVDAGNQGDFFSWSDGSLNETLTASTSGTYIVTVTDPQSGCAVSASINIYIQPTPYVNLGNDVNQCGGFVTLDAGNPGDLYSWSTTETTQTITVNSSNDYSVTVTDPNSGCSASSGLSINISPVPVVGFGSNITQCGGNVTLDAGNPGDFYNWSDGSNNETLVVATSGTYSVTVSDDAGCSASASIEIYIEPTPYVNLGNDTNQCGGTVTLNAGNPGDSYSWSDGETTQIITVSTSNDYSVTVTDPNSGCSSSSGLSVGISALPVINLGPDTSQCGGSVILDAGNPGSSYLWSDGSTNETLQAGTTGLYSVTVTDDAGCSASASVNVYILTIPTVYLGRDVEQCGGSVILDAGNPGYGYLWSTNATSQTVEVFITDPYSVTITDPNNGCQAADTINVTIDTIPVVNLGPDTTQCGGSITLDAGSPGATYLWSDNSTNETLNVSSSSIYRVTVTNSNGCSAVGSITVTINPVPVVKLTLPHDVCITVPPFALSGGSPPGGGYFEADTSITIFAPYQQGIGSHEITYVYTNNFGCTDSDSAAIFVHPQPFITTKPTDTLCTTSSEINLNNYFTPAGGAYTGIGISGDYFYPNLVPPGIDTIIDIYTDNFGCMDTSKYLIEVHRPVHVTLISSVADYTICLNQDITFTATGADDYQFFVNDTPQGNASSANVFTTNTLSNHSFIYVVGSNHCSTDTSEPIVIDVINPPVVYAGRDTTIDLGQTVQLNGIATGTGNLTYLWTPGNGLNFVNVPNPTYSGSDSITFWFKATDSYGCTDSDNVSVFVFVPDNVLLPNLITPNGDGFNDVWKLNPKINLDGSHIVIFDRWGQTVYETDNYANNWGGTYKSTGQKLPDDTYYYVLKVPALHDHVYEGPINIISGGNVK